MKCGQVIYVKDFYGTFVVRFIAQCEGRFLMITNGLDGRNGYMLPDWHGVLRELIALAVPAKMIEKTRSVEAAALGPYVSFPLTYPLSVSNFVNVLGVPAVEVRAELADLAVMTDEV